MDAAQTEKLKALALAATKGPWQRCERLTGPFWHISSDHTIGGEPCKSGRQAIAAVHGESKRGAKAYAAMFEANANFIAAANPATVIELIADHDKTKLERDELRAEVERLRAAAKAVVREALDSVSVHPCDYNDDSVRAKSLYGVMAELYAATRCRAEGGNTSQVGCEHDDGLLNIHAESETCEVCSAHTKAREGA